MRQAMKQFESGLRDCVRKIIVFKTIKFVGVCLSTAKGIQEAIIFPSRVIVNSNDLDRCSYIQRSSGFEKLKM